MKRFFHLFGASALLSLSLACVNHVPGSVSYPEPSSPQRENGNQLADLLTGSVISEAEQQLRDTLQRQIVLDFPIRLGVLFYQHESKLERVDREAAFQALRNHITQSELAVETVQIPESLITPSTNIDTLRSLGARFQTDILILVSGTHTFAQARNQELSFFDSFSDKAYFESEVYLEALALDVYTGTFLNPFNVAIKGEPRLLDRSNASYRTNVYQYQKEVETTAWQALQAETLQRLLQLKRTLESRQAALPPQPESEGETAS